MSTNERYSREQIRAFQQLMLTARRARSLTQIEAAHSIGVSQALISSLERGPSSGMRVGELFRVLGFYGIHPDEVARILGYLPVEESTRVELPQVRRVLLLLDAVPLDVLDQIVMALDLMVKGALA